VIKKIKSGLNKRKVKIFLLFLVCATLAWFISNLSEEYTSNSQFGLLYENVPDSLFFTSASKNVVELKLRTNGFQFLGLNSIKKNLKIDLSEVDQAHNKYFLQQSVFRKQIEKQLPGSVSLLEVGLKDTLFLDLYKLHTIEVPVKSRLNLKLEQNYVLGSPLQIEPESISISGPKSEIDSIKYVGTEVVDLLNVTDNFQQILSLKLPAGLTNTKFSEKKVTVTGEVFRFSEKIITLPVEVLNLPTGMEIRTFPDKVSVLCKAKIDALKQIDASSFKLVADYKEIKEGNSILQLRLTEKPKNIYSAKLMETEVEFILRRK